MKIQIIVPIYHPDNKFLDLLDSISRQIAEDYSLLILDSGSAKQYKQKLSSIEHTDVWDIDPRTFNHGRTRQMGIDRNPDKDIFIFLTQDAILADDKAIQNLIDAFENPRIGCAYGRQLPHKDANIFASIARNFNYGEKSQTRFYEDRKQYGIKTAFISNSFAAYRREAMEEVGGFPNDVILSEDMCVAAKMLLKGWGVAYVADAKVYHSHNYTVMQEFKRYFDIGVFHARESWIRDNFGTAEKTGSRFIAYEFKKIKEKDPWRLPEMVLRDGTKFLGYRLGIKESLFSYSTKKKVSMMPRYWEP